MVAVIVVRPNRRSVHAFDEGALQSGAATRTSIPAENLGDEVTFGGVVLFNHSKRSVVLEDVRVVPPLMAGMEIIAVQVAGSERPIGYVGADRGYPPPDLAPYLRAYRGAVVSPDRTPEGKDGVELVFGLRVTQTGKFGFRRIDVDYRVGGERHTVRLKDGFVGCGPHSAYPKGCDHAVFAREPS